MKIRRISTIAALGIILALLVTLVPAPALAASEYLFVYPYEGKVGDWIELDGYTFLENEIVNIYFSSEKAAEGELIDFDVTAYEMVLRASTDAYGNFNHTYSLFLPEALTDGEDVEDVHDGTYYFYATYLRSQTIVAIAGFIVIGGEISVSPEEGVIGTEIEIQGVGLRPYQAIAIEYDGDLTEISGGDTETDKNGDFTCTIIVPPSSAGGHIVNAVDESGNTPEATFTVKPVITIDPTQQITGGTASISGNGFEKRASITITLDDEEVITTPEVIKSDHYGNFEATFLVPTGGSYGTREVEASDTSLNKAATEITVQGGLTINPETSLTSPGYVGMEVRINGSGFTPDSTITISYINGDESLPIGELTSKDGTFWLDFNIPPSVAGIHEIVVTDGTSTATAIFHMEAYPPLTPTPLTPNVAETVSSRAHFAWSAVSDESGISYSLQIAIDADFHGIVLNKTGLQTLEYTLTEAEALDPTEKESPYYWRVQSVDGASNTSGWSYPQLFYVGFSWGALPTWAWTTLGIIAVLGLASLGFWQWRKRARAKIKTM
ncbi:MAG: hypothetical protein PVJ61_02570 [Dehalococcoidia bacterium]|jgi:hypothetical protein